MTWKININSDMGEGYGRWRLGPDEELIPLVPTVSIACGFHAGDPRIVCRVTARALEEGVDVGSQVSLPDLRGFGCRPVGIGPEDLHDDVLYQVGTLVLVMPTLCLHGDLPNVLEVTHRVREEDTEVVGLTPALADFAPAESA